jgi:hypothetical protein
MVTAGILPFRENSHGTAGNRTRDLMIQRLRPLDHEAGPFEFKWDIIFTIKHFILSIVLCDRRYFFPSNRHAVWPQRYEHHIISRLKRLTSKWPAMSRPADTITGLKTLFFYGLFCTFFLVFTFIARTIWSVLVLTLQLDIKLSSHQENK